MRRDPDLETAWFNLPISVPPEESEHLFGELEADLAALPGLKSDVPASSQFLLGSSSFRTCDVTDIKLNDFLAFPISSVGDHGRRHGRMTRADPDRLVFEGGVGQSKTERKEGLAGEIAVVRHFFNGSSRVQ